MGSLSEQQKYINRRINDSLSISSVDYKLKLGSASSNKINFNNNQSVNIQSDTRENTKIAELKEDFIPFKFIWNKGGKNVKISGTFLDNWKNEIELEKNNNTGSFEKVINLTPTKHEFKFIVDNIWLCSEQYEILNDKNNYNNIIDLTNYSQKEKNFQEINDKLKKNKRKCSKEFGCNYLLRSDFDREVPNLPNYFKKSFDLNKRKKQKILKKNFKLFLNFNLSKNILENNDYKTITTISHEKLSHVCFQPETDYNNENDNKYIKSSITQRINHKFLTFIYYTPKK